MSDLANTFQREAERWVTHSSLSSRGLEGAMLPRRETASAGSAEAASREEATLLARARTGDQEAFGTLVRQHQRQVYTLALRMLHDVDEASEATQEAFLQAWQGLRSFRGDARFGTWLYRITYNHCLKVSQTRLRDRAARTALREESARRHNWASVISAQYALAAERDLCEAVRAEMATLPPKYRAVLVLRHLQDFSYEEMAEIMRVPIGTVKTQLFRARAMLKERLEGLARAGSDSLPGIAGITNLTGGIAQGIARASELGAELGAGLRTMWERTLWERTLWERTLDHSHNDNPRRGEG